MKKIGSNIIENNFKTGDPLSPRDDEDQYTVNEPHPKFNNYKAIFGNLTKS